MFASSIRSRLVRRLSVVLALSLAAMVFVGIAACSGQKPNDVPLSPFGLPTESTGGARGLLSYSVPCYVAQGGANIVAASGCTVSVESGGLLSFSGGAIHGHTIYGTATPATVVTGTALAPGAFVQPITIATAGTVPLTIPSAGVRVCIHNTGSQAVTIADTGNQVLASTFAMGQYDVLCGFSDGTRFIETSRSNN